MSWQYWIEDARRRRERQQMDRQAMIVWLAMCIGLVLFWFGVGLALGLVIG